MGARERKKGGHRTLLGERALTIVNSESALQKGETPWEETFYHFLMGSGAKKKGTPRTTSLTAPDLRIKIVRVSDEG